MSRKILKFWKLPPEERRLLLRGVMWFALVGLAIHFMSMKVIRKWFVTNPNASNEYDQNLNYSDKLLQVKKTIHRLNRNLPWTPKCLAKALVAKKLLGEFEHASELWLGIKKENENWVAHAWLRCNHDWITGGNDSADYPFTFAYH